MGFFFAMMQHNFEMNMEIMMQLKHPVNSVQLHSTPSVLFCLLHHCIYSLQRLQASQCQNGNLVN